MSFQIDINDLKYGEITQTEARGLDFSQLMTKSWEELRWNDDNSLCMVVWYGDTPATLAAIRGFTPLTSSTVKTQLRTPGNSFRTRPLAPPRKPR
jgi:hypothetical protein